MWFSFTHFSLFSLQVIIEVPHIFLQAVVYGVIVYSCIGFDWTVEKFFWYLFFTYFTFMYFTFYGMMAVAMTPNSDIGAIVSTAFYAIWNIFAGYLIPRPVSSPQHPSTTCYALMLLSQNCLLTANMHFSLFSEDPRMVEMVLLYLSSCIFLIWTCWIPIRGIHKYAGGQWHRSEGFSQQLFWNSAQTCGISWRCSCWVHSALCIHLCCLNQSVQLPEKMRSHIERFALNYVYIHGPPAHIFTLYMVSSYFFFQLDIDA